MAKFVFTADPNQGRRGVKKEESDQSRGIKAFGIKFPRGEEVEVTDERIVSKLRGNSHFTEVVGNQDDGSAVDRKALVDRAIELGLKPGNKSADKLAEEIAAAEQKASEGNQDDGSGD